jgi:hypothetical protein
MNRASWKGALLAGLASAGIAWGQPPAVPGSGARPAERVVTLRQSDGLPESCRLLKAWTTDDGRKAWLVQSVDTDMRLTVVQKARGPVAARADVGVSIYPWGNSDVPPEGSPVPPPGGDIVPAAYTTEAPAVVGRHAPQMPVVSSAAGCAPGHRDKCAAPCDQVHHYEQPPTLHFVCGGCLPVCGPEHSATYGYYPTQWRPYPGCAEAAPPAQAEPLPAPKVTLP